MIIRVEANKLEEVNHPFYVVRYIVLNEEKELFSSLARYVAGKNGVKVQLLEPDMRKMLKMGLDKYLDKPLQEEITQVVKEKVETYLAENND